MFVYRPAMADPPLATWMECERATIDQIADMHEALDLREAAIKRASKRGR